MGNLAIYCSFKLEQNKISKTLCVQRQFVNNSCNGRCVLQKTLKKFEDNERSMEKVLKEKAEIVYICNFNTVTYQLFSPEIISTPTPLTRIEKPITVTNSIFHPPLFTV